MAHVTYDGLMMGFQAPSCVYRLEELVGLLPDQLRASVEEGEQWEEELVLNQSPQATSPLRIHHLDQLL